MVVMAIEAVQQMATDENRIIAAYLIKEAQFLSPIVIGESSQDSTETEHHVLPTRNGQDKDTTWSARHGYSPTVTMAGQNASTRTFVSSMSPSQRMPSTAAANNVKHASEFGNA